MNNQEKTLTTDYTDCTDRKVNRGTHELIGGHIRIIY